jgi:predicted metal-binding membrane protein
VANASGIEAVLRRDRSIILAALAAVTVLSWVYVLHLAGQMSMGGMDMTGFRMVVNAASMIMKPGMESWSASEFVFTLGMWTIMMIGMMVPSAAPIILLFARVGRQAAAERKPFASTGWFAGGYLFIWTVFAAVATTAQWALDRAALLTPAMALANVLGGIVLIGAGIYQWTTFKDRCLSHCESPLAFIQHHGGFPRKSSGAFRLGMLHGAYCTGCCWALMALLFVGGVMNVLWIAGLTLLVLAEKALPAGRTISRAAGILLVVGGAWLVLIPR